MCGKFGAPSECTEYPCTRVHKFAGCTVKHQFNLALEIWWGAQSIIDNYAVEYHLIDEAGRYIQIDSFYNWLKLDLARTMENFQGVVE